MSKNLPTTDDDACCIGPCVFDAQAAPGQAQALRDHLRRFVASAAEGRLPLALPPGPGDGVVRGEGHFHLTPELFLQVAGWTRFRFPHGEHLLPAGQALLVPPRLLHAERVGAGDAGEAFCNLVVRAEGQVLTCHLAHETAPGRPGILHLETSRHAQATRVHDWLRDASPLGDAGSPWAAAQARALVAAAAAGVLRALDEADPAEAPEPALVARVRVLAQNQLGDQALSVRRLADQCGCSADYLSHVFGRATGEHLAAYIVRQRMERAARLLGESAMAGKEVAWACGFATQSYFSRSFRTHFGVTPKAWRASSAAR